MFWAGSMLFPHKTKVFSVGTKVLVSLKIAQPFMTGFTVWECSKSRQGRKVLADGQHVVCRPWRDLVIWVALFPAINGWAIFSETRLTAYRVMAKRLLDVCPWREPFPFPELLLP